MKEQGFLQKSFIRTCGGQTPGSRPKGHSLLLAQRSWQGQSTVSRGGAESHYPGPGVRHKRWNSRALLFRDPLPWAQLSTQHGRRGEGAEPGHTAFSLGCPVPPLLRSRSGMPIQWGPELGGGGTPDK